MPNPADKSSVALVDPASFHVIFRNGVGWYGVQIRHVVAAVTNTAIVRVPGARPGIVGIAHFHGKIISVIDIRPCFQVSSTIDYDSSHAILVVRHGQEEIGIIADEIGEATPIAPNQYQAIEDVLGASRRFMRAFARNPATDKTEDPTSETSVSAIVIIDLPAILTEICRKL